MIYVILAIVLLGATAYYVFNTMQEMKMKQGEKAVEEGDMDVAFSIFMESLKRDPENVEALWHLGNINEEKGNKLEAIGYYNRLIEMGKESTLFTKFELNRRIGKLYKESNRDRDALEYYFRAYQLIPTAKEPLKNIAILLLSQKQFYRSLPYFEKGAPSLENDEEFQKYYSLNLIMVDSINDAVSRLEELERNFQANHEAKFMLSYGYAKMRAWKRSREVIEDVANSEKIVLTKDQMFYIIKILFLSYTMDKQYEVARELHKKMENMMLDEEEKNLRWGDAVNMAYIFLRYKQGYFDLALEKLNNLIDVSENFQEEGDEFQNKIREKTSFLYDNINKLNEFKQEQERRAVSGAKADVNFNILESAAHEAKPALDKLFDDWQQKFLDSESIWNYFKPPSGQKFDPVPILERYSEENVKEFKNKFKAKQKTSPSKINSFKTLGIDFKDVCGSFQSMDFPSFSLVAKELARVMGYRVLNQEVKVDQVAYSEGQGVDLIAESPKDHEHNVLFCLRRWRQPIGIITVQNLLGAMKDYRSTKVILVTTSPLSEEAKKAVEKEANFEYYHCDQISAFMR